MATKANYSTSDLGWQLEKMGRQVGEWVEVIAKGQRERIPDVMPPPWLTSVLNFLAWTGFIFLAAWLGLQLYRLLHSLWLERYQVKPRKKNIQATADRSPTAWLKLAQDWVKQGNYREACRALYLGLLQILEDRDILPRNLSRTDTEICHLLAQQALQNQQEYFMLIRLHEQLFFSSVVISESNFQSCQTAFKRIAMP